MREFWNMLQFIFAAAGGGIGWFFGGCGGLLYALIAFTAVDYITGVMRAVADKKLSSDVGYKGIAKKVLAFLLVGVANVLDVQVIGTGSALRTAVLLFYLANEGVSILENAGRLGLPIPERLREILRQLHDRAEKEAAETEAAETEIEAGTAVETEKETAQAETEAKPEAERERGAEP